MLPDAPTLTRDDYEAARDAAEAAGEVRDGKHDDIIPDTMWLTADAEAVDAARAELAERVPDYATVTVNEYHPTIRPDVTLVAFGVEATLTARVRRAVAASVA